MTIHKGSPLRILATGCGSSGGLHHTVYCQIYSQRNNLIRRICYVQLVAVTPGHPFLTDTDDCPTRLAGFSPSVQMDIRTVPGAKNMLFGGEGVFNTVLTGPGRVWLQTMPIYNVANAIRPYIPTGNN